jgi:hypothetical protein
MVVLLLAVAFPWLVWKLLTNPRSILAGGGPVKVP